MNRRTSLLLMGSATLALISGCSASMLEGEQPDSIRFQTKGIDEFVKDYNKREDQGFKLPKIPVKKIDDKFLRQRVAYSTRERPGTIIVDVKNRFLYLVEPDRTALRYGVSVGKAGFAWEGEANVGWKRAWPTWTPPEEMIERKPSLKRYSAENGGMEPGLKNPLGARALYIFQDGQDTLYRLHGTPEWSSIGKAASSGCIRLINQDIIDLYDRVKGRPKVIVKQ
ncbi:MAG: L,D-transpeptidase [Nitratireductor sp.]